MATVSVQNVDAGDLAAVLPVAVEQTVENQITERLRTLIVEGSLKPGVRLRYRDVAARARRERHARSRLAS